jgi:hypothetical protein
MRSGNDMNLFRRLTLVYSTRNLWVSRLCPSIGVLNTRKHNVSETGFLFAFEWQQRDTYLLGPLERDNLSHWRFHYSNSSFSLKVQLLLNSFWIGHDLITWGPETALASTDYVRTEALGLVRPLQCLRLSPFWGCLLPSPENRNTMWPQSASELYRPNEVSTNFCG